MKKFTSFLIHLLLINQIISAQSIILCAQEKEHASVSKSILKHEKNYKPGVAIVKLKAQYKQIFSSDRANDLAIQNILEKASFKNMKALFPHHISREYHHVDLSLIYELQFDYETDIPVVCKTLMGTGKFEYAEPRFYVEMYSIDPGCVSGEVAFSAAMMPDFVPNDSLFSRQASILYQIKAPQAWDVERGDTNVVIGIVDTGTDYHHPDLRGNLVQRYVDPINGVDDDQNGYIDDINGWDLSNNDNDPSCPISNVYLYHGTKTASIAAATTDNAIGLASSGFHCRYLPVKASNDSFNVAFLDYGFEGIVYAAEQGVKVINCSWGGNLYSKYQEDIIRYAVLDKDVLIICSAGNSGNEETLFPSCYPYAMGVAGVDDADAKVDYSTYNHQLDISSPVMPVIAIPGGAYSVNGYGTSFASPLVSGAAALVRSHFPHLNALQTKERIRVTSDPIDSLNSGFEEKIGKGRLNIFRALTDTDVKAVRLNEVVFTDNNDDIFKVGDTIRISGQFVNYLDPTTSLVCKISSPSAEITFLNDRILLGHLETLESRDNKDLAFTFIINSDAKNDITIPFRISFNDGTYTDWQWINCPAKINRSFINIGNDRIATSVNSAGRFGTMYDNNEEGVGFHYFPADSIEFRMTALMIGNSSIRVSDATYGNYPTFEKDFQIIHPIHQVIGSPLADQVYECSYSDSMNYGQGRMDLDIEQQILIWNGEDYLITEYRITNRSNRTYSSLYVGLEDEIDIGIGTYNKNRNDEKSIVNLGFMTSAVGTKVVSGTQLLSSTPFIHYALEWSDTYGGVNILDGFSNAEKYLTLSRQRDKGGFEYPQGTDCAQVVATGPLSLLPGETITVAFSLLAGLNEIDLEEHALSAIGRYESFVTKIDPVSGKSSSLNVYPNPANDILHVSLNDGKNMTTGSINVFDVQGVLLLQKSMMGNEVEIDISSLSSGIYFVRSSNSFETITSGFIKD